MAKDPAMLWYWNDWYSGTILMSRFLKGCYIDVLHAQFNHGPLSLEEIKTCLGSDFGQAWPAIQKKFAQTGTGLFFNERLEQEKEKRQKFTESRRKNRTKKDMIEDMCNHMSPHMENRNRNEDCIKGVQGDWTTFPGPESYGLELPEIANGAIVQLLKITKNVDATKEQVNSLWEVFKVQCFTGKKFYQHSSDAVSHFMNWSKLQTVAQIEKTIKQPAIDHRQAKGQAILDNL